MHLFTPHVQTAQLNPHSQLLNTPLSAQGVALGPIAKHHQTPNSPLSSLTSSSRSQARSQASSHGVDVTSEQVLHACHIAGCSEGLIKQAKQNHEPGLLAMILNYQVIEEVLTSVGQCNLEESERFLGVFDWNSLNSEVHSERLLEAFGWNVHSFQHKRRWYSWPADLVQTKHWNPQCLSEGDIYGLWLAITYMWSDNGPIRQKEWPQGVHLGWTLTQDDIMNAKKKF